MTDTDTQNQSESVPEFWQETLRIIRKDVGQSVFDLWFEPIHNVRLEDAALTVSLPNRFFKEWIDDYHPTLIQETVSKLSGKNITVNYEIEAPAAPVVQKAEARMEKRKDKLARRGLHLNPKYTFESFVVGPSNEFARAASEAVAKTPGRTYNPLFIYGGVGLGKTHLITAIGNRVIDRHKDFNILFVTAEQFTNEVVSAIRHGKTEELKEKFRGLDMLLIDDIQFIENKPTTQDELFHTLNALHDQQKQIVIASDRPPMEILKVTDRLRTRFGMGLIADIQSPDMETRIAIIQKKAEAEAIRLSEEVINYIASRVKSNVREMEGCIIRIGAHMSLTGAQATLALVKTLLKDVVAEDDKPLGAEGIIKAVAEHFGLRVQDIKSRKRTKDIALPRQIAMYIARELTPSSLAEIGKAVGGKDHATVIYAAKQIEAKRAADESFDRLVANLIARIKQ